MPVSPAKEKSGSKKHKDVNSLTGRQKVAIFLISLGGEISAKVMEQLREDEVEKIVFEIARIETIESELKDAVLQEFQDLMMAQNFITTGGIDYARDVLEKTFGGQKATEVINRLTTSLQVRPFDFIRRTDPARLFWHILSQIKLLRFCKICQMRFKVMWQGVLQPWIEHLLMY